MNRYRKYFNLLAIAYSILFIHKFIPYVEMISYFLFLYVVVMLSLENKELKIIIPFAYILIITSILRLFMNRHIILIVLIELYFHFQLLTNISSFVHDYDEVQEKRLLRCRDLYLITNTLSIILLRLNIIIPNLITIYKYINYIHLIIIGILIYELIATKEYLEQ